MLPTRLAVPANLALSDLHRHLDGSLRRSTMEDLVALLHRPVPEDLLFFPGMGLSEALARFAFTLSLLQEPDMVRRVASEICDDARADGVTTLEIRFAPQLHRGGSIEIVVDAALEGISGRAGLILCGLYGEPPEVLQQLVEVATSRPGVVGIDLAGGPAPSHRFLLDDYAPAFLRAEAVGLGRTVHAAEGRPPGEIQIAIERLHTQRIGHGTTLLQDRAVLDLVLDRGVTIEACPSSNWHTGVIPSFAAHPLPRWLEVGVKVCVCPDNTLLSNVTAREELERVAAIPGISSDSIRAVVGFGHQAAFRR